MSFLSSEQRQRAIGQQQAYVTMLDDDLNSLTLRIADVHELRRCAKHNISRIIAADEGECPIDEIQQTDDYARIMMERGISHYPVVITSGEKRVVKA